MGKPSAKGVFEAFKGHFKRGSVLLHDGDHSHNRIVDELGLSSEVLLPAGLI